MDNIDLSPAERRRAKVRGSILEAAERVFACEGEEGLSIRRLAEEIDYSPAAIYKYFGSKEELIEELKEAFFERFLERIDACRGSGKPFGESARDCLQTYVATALERPHHYAAAFTAINASAGETVLPKAADEMDWDKFCLTKKGQAFRQLIDMVIEGQEAGVFIKEMDPYLAAKSLWASSHGLAQLLTHLPHFPNMLPRERRTAETRDVDAFIRFHTDLIMRGLEVSPIRKDGPIRISNMQNGVE